jgi:hypothetical protein
MVRLMVMPNLKTRNIFGVPIFSLDQFGGAVTSYTGRFPPGCIVLLFKWI